MRSVFPLQSGRPASDAHIESWQVGHDLQTLERPSERPKAPACLS